MYGKIKSLFSVINVLHYVCHLSPVNPSKIEGELLRHLLKDSNPWVRPVLHPSTTLNLTFNMQLWQVLSVDEKEQKITIQNYFQTAWMNEFLTWKPKDWGGVRSLTVRPEEVWIPDIVLLNSADGSGSTIQQHTDIVNLYHTGYTTWFPKVMMVASFRADTKYFPFDTQHFEFRFESWSLPSSKLRLVDNNHSLVDEHYVNSSEWRLTRARKKISLQEYNGDVYSDMNFNFTFARKPSYFVMKLILPCVILLTIVLFSYFLPASSGERMAVVVTSLLGFAVFLETVSASLPQNSNSTSILSAYILVTMFECAVSFFVTCIVITLLHKTTNSRNVKPPPQWVRKVFSLKVSKKDDVNRWSPDMRGKDNGSFHIQDNALILHTRRSYNSMILRKKSNLVSSVRLTRLENIENNIKQIAMLLNERDGENEIHIEWVRLSNVVDRLSFWVFLIIALLSGLVLALGFERYY